MPLPSQPHTFGLENCRDMLRKLEWEIEQFEAETEMPALSYKAFNCAVTAWHISDWVFADLKSEGRPPAASRGAFQQQCRDQSEALRMCRLIANGSKHAGIEVDKREIETDVSAEAEHLRYGQARFGDRFVTYRWRISISTGPEHRRDIITVFSAALDYWTQLIYSQQIGC